MKRNMRFLLLFSILLSSILAVYFISGCGDDSTIIESQKIENDTVVGTISGTVSDAADASHLANCKVVWTHAGVDDSTTTNGNGYFTTGPTLSSGDYTLTFYPANNSHAAAEGMATIHSVAWHRADNPNAAGIIIEEVPLNPDLWPMTGTLSGYVFTALPLGAPGKDGQPLALDDPNNATAAANVTVTLDFGAFNVIGNTYTSITDADGHYSFTSAPACENHDNNPDTTAADTLDQWVVLRTGQFSDNGIDYGGTEYSGAGGELPITMGYIVPNVFAPLFGQDQRDLDPAPVVISYNWDGTTLGVTEDLVMVFSTAMDITKTGASFGGLAFYGTWSADYMTLTLDPVDVLATGTSYALVVAGESVSGLTLIDSDATVNFERTVWTQGGIGLMSTNFGTVGTKTGDSTYVNFDLDADLVLTFNMEVDADHSENVITFMLGGTPVDFTTTYSGAVVTIDPEYTLVSGQIYDLTFTFYGMIENDADTSAWTYLLSTFDDAVTPATPTGFAYDTTLMTWPVDYNTASVYLEWAIQADADSFFIYADAEYTPLGRTIVARTGSQQYGIKQGTTVTLPSEFDVYGDAQQTPFAGGNVVSFWVRAWNTSDTGYSAYTDSIMFDDDQAPENFLAAQWGDGDNTAGAAEDTVVFLIGTAGSPIEYLEEASGTFSFTEAGGDRSYAFDGTVAWDDDNSLTYGTGTMYVPATSCAAGDWVVVGVTDNSGNTGYDSMLVLPWFEYVNPHPDSAAGQFEANDADVKFISHWARELDGTDTLVISNVDIFLSFDGSTFVDSVMAEPIGDSGVVNTVDFAIDDTLMIADVAQFTVANAGGAGAANWSAGFSVAGIMLTGPDSLSYYNVFDTIIDRDNTDSASIPISWTQVGLDFVEVWYSTDGANFTVFDTVAAAGTPYAFYPPNINGTDAYNCWVRVADHDADSRPQNSTSWYFHVFHDSVTFTAPLAAGTFVGGSTTNIQWDNGVTAINDSLPSKFTIEYATNAAGADTTWQSLATSETNDGILNWVGVPQDDPSVTCLLRFTDGGGNYYPSPLFNISGLIVTAPDSAQDCDCGVASNITWTNIAGFAGNVSLDYSADGGTTWDTIRTDQANTGTFAWTLPNDANNQMKVRVKEFGGTITDMSDYNSIMAGYVITYPDAKTVTWVWGRQDSVTWTTYGTPATFVDILYENKAGVLTGTIASGYADNGVYGFSVPDLGVGTYPDSFMVMVKGTGATPVDTTGDWDSGAGVGKYFEVDEPHITITAPTGASTWQQSTPGNVITWKSVGTVSDSVIISCYSVGADFTAVVIDTVATSSSANTYTWTIPNLGLVAPSTDARIKIDDLGSSLTTETANFTINN